MTVEFWLKGETDLTVLGYQVQVSGSKWTHLAFVWTNN